MTISSNMYVPILKWRQGEYQALMRLKDSIKDLTYPLLVIPPVEFDFEEERPKKTVQDHIEPFSTRFSKKWGQRKALIDLHESLENESMDDGSPVISSIFTSLRSENCNAIPVARFANHSNYVSHLKAIIATDKQGVAIRLKLPELMSSNINSQLGNMISDLEVTAESTDLIIDLEVPQSFEPYNAFSKALATAIKRIDNINQFRSFVISGMSLKLSEVQRPGAEPTRHEWMLYQHLVKELGDTRKPTYSDYTIETPDFISMDMRLLNPAGKIVYATSDTWLITKGKSFRDNRSQMIDQCATIVHSTHYCGKDYSHGDNRIFETYKKIDGTGGLGTWKEVGISHHITLVVNQLAKYHAS